MSTNAPENRAFLDLSRFALDRELMQKLGREYCEEKQVVLLGTADADAAPHVYLGMLDASDEKTLFEVCTKIGSKVQAVQLNRYEYEKALSHAFPRNDDAFLSDTADDKTHAPLALDFSRKITFAEDQAAADLVTDMLSDAVTRRASDIHNETYEDDVDVRFRIDGVLHQVPTPVSPANVKKICSFMRILSDLDITERRVAQDGRIAATYTNEAGRVRQIDLRISILPGSFGSDMVLRVLDAKRISLGVDELGMSDVVHRRWRNLIHAPDGLIVVAGPTASGKTTTLYSAIRDINSDENKVLTVEDTIEYRLPRVSQKQVSPTMSFADYARAFMRQDPDVLMIGEIRDEETAHIALRAAQMGHLVFTTIHANNALTAISRLVLLGTDKTLVSTVLSGVLSQRLVRKICPNCEQPYEPAPAVLAMLPALPPDLPFMHGTGCDACNHRGYLGQTGIFELLVPTESMRESLASGIALTGDDDTGFVSMYRDAIERLRDGITTIEEILRGIPLPGE